MNSGVSKFNFNEDLKIGRVYAKERQNDFLLIMRFIIAASIFFSVALLVF